MLAVVGMLVWCHAGENESKVSSCISKCKEKHPKFIYLPPYTKMQSESRLGNGNKCVLARAFFASNFCLHYINISRRFCCSLTHAWMYKLSFYSSNNYNKTATKIVKIHFLVSYFSWLSDMNKQIIGWYKFSKQMFISLKICWNITFKYCHLFTFIIAVLFSL